MRRRTNLIAAAFLIAGLAGGNALAQNSDSGGVARSSGVRESADAQVAAAADFGTGTNILQIPAAAFTIRSGPALTYTSLGYLAYTGSTSLWAAVYLPAGALISFLDAYYCDAGAGSITFFLTRYEGSQDGDRVTNDITSFSSIDGGGLGCQYHVHGFSHSVNNNVIYNGGGQYVINAQGSAGPSFKAVDIWWSRPISPAPASASFTDVPTGHQFFKEIEALKASGITGGCTATTYCPDQAVTRGQMAAFLARALGLYWPL